MVGDRAAFPPDRGRSVAEFKDGTAQTIALIEAPHMHIGWAEPRDLTMDEAVEFLSSPPESNDYGHPINAGFFYKPSRGVHVAFVDGWVRLLKLPIKREHAQALLTVDGGESIDPSNIPTAENPEIDYARIYSLSVFVLLTLLPAINLRKKSRHEKRAET